MKTPQETNPMVYDRHATSNPSTQSSWLILFDFTGDEVVHPAQKQSGRPFNFLNLGTPCNFPEFYFGLFSAVRTTFLSFDCRPKFCIFNLKMLTLRTSTVNLWHLGVDLSIFRCQKHFRGGHIPLLKINLFLGGLFWAPPIVHTPFTGVARWKLKGLSGSFVHRMMYG
jgi:hypothetical protein